MRAKLSIMSLRDRPEYYLLMNLDFSYINPRVCELLHLNQEIIVRVLREEIHFSKIERYGFGFSLYLCNTFQFKDIIQNKTLQKYAKHCEYEGRFTAKSRSFLCEQQYFGPLYCGDRKILAFCAPHWKLSTLELYRMNVMPEDKPCQNIL